MAELEEAEFDEHGWHIGAVEAWPPASAYAVLAPERSSRIDEARWRHQAERFFALSGLAVTPAKSYQDATPLFDTATLALGEAGAVELITMPADRAPEVLAAAQVGVARMGGAGFDVLVARTQRVWQLRAPNDGAALLGAAILASVLLGPIVAPDGAVFGVKTARERLAANELAARRR